MRGSILPKENFTITRVLGHELQFAIEIEHEPWLSIGIHMLEKLKELIEDEELDTEPLEEIITLLKERNGRVQ